MRDFSELIARLKQSDDNCNAECCECSGECLSSGCNIFSEAADAIEELLAESADLVGQVKRSQEEIRKLDKLLAAVPKWISVEERLPDVAEKVLTYNGDFVSENWLCTVASKVGRINVWAYSDGFVTHWMPLPEPPKEVE